MKEHLKNFFFPKFTKGFFIRLALTALLVYIFFAHICTPTLTRGTSMEPNYPDGSLVMCWKLPFIIRPVTRGDVVMIRLAGPHVMYLKRVVALEGEILEIRDGVVYVDGNALNEAYVKYECDWKLAPRKVKSGNVYLIGDNRRMPIENHVFGQTPAARIQGKALW